MMGLIARAIELAGAGGVLVLTVGVGMIAHELSHAVVLRSIGVPYRIELISIRDVSGLFVRDWASVTPHSIPSETPSWGLRCAALAPLVLATPFLLVIIGIFPDPVGSGNPFLTAAVVAWFGCALPSPQDFSWFWYANRLMEL